MMQQSLQLNTSLSPQPSANAKLLVVGQLSNPSPQASPYHSLNSPNQLVQQHHMRHMVSEQLPYPFAIPTGLQAQMGIGPLMGPGQSINAGGGGPALSQMHQQMGSLQYQIQQQQRAAQNESQQPMQDYNNRNLHPNINRLMDPYQQHHQQPPPQAYAMTNNQASFNMYRQQQQQPMLGNQQQQQQSSINNCMMPQLSMKTDYSVGDEYAEFPGQQQNHQSLQHQLGIGSEHSASNQRSQSPTPTQHQGGISIPQFSTKIQFSSLKGSRQGGHFRENWTYKGGVVSLAALSSKGLQNFTETSQQQNCIESFSQSTLNQKKPSGLGMLVNNCDNGQRPGGLNYSNISGAQGLGLQQAQCQNEDVNVTSLYKSQREAAKHQVLSQGQKEVMDAAMGIGKNAADLCISPQLHQQMAMQNPGPVYGTVMGSIRGLDISQLQNQPNGETEPYHVEDYAKLAEFYYSLMPKSGQNFQSKAQVAQREQNPSYFNLVSVKDLPQVRGLREQQISLMKREGQSSSRPGPIHHHHSTSNAGNGAVMMFNEDERISSSNTGHWNNPIQTGQLGGYGGGPNGAQGNNPAINAPVSWGGWPQPNQQHSHLNSSISQAQGNDNYSQFKQSWKNLEYLKHPDIIKIPYNCYLQERHSLFLNNFHLQFQRGRELMDYQNTAMAAQKANGGLPTGMEVFQRFTDAEIEKIQKFVLKDTFNKKKKTIVFELEGVLVNLLTQEEAQQIQLEQLSASGLGGGSIRNDSKPIIQIKSTTAADNIITYKEYYVQFRPYLLHMLRALKPFFELVIFTDKSKEEAEAIINEIEKEQNFFTYIIPVNYCYYIPSESVYVKDLSIFFGNRLEGEVAMVTSQAFDGLLQPVNSVPVEPFIGDENDRLLLILEAYLMNLRWCKDIRHKLQLDFPNIYGEIQLPPLVSPGNARQQQQSQPQSQNSNNINFNGGNAGYEQSQSLNSNVQPQSTSPQLQLTLTAMNGGAGGMVAYQAPPTGTQQQQNNVQQQQQSLPQQMQPLMGVQANNSLNMQQQQQMFQMQQQYSPYMQQQMMQQYYQGSNNGSIMMGGGQNSGVGGEAAYNSQKPQQYVYQQSNY
ncbi:hypothetical protein FGO68_gene7031 [Halteria grandinella]|uniref:FCP1 homology domain-containing protein n=1 Tax=Halteria grandinella TaxID=5974 RepID=A0A8J8P2I0_HALGN|nr:hypothetical protein FGO68_gene7031 [Halteria grandinella]